VNAPGFARPQAVAAPVAEELEPLADAPRPRGGRRTAHGRLAAGLLTAGLLLIALNLRIGVASVGPA
jgi:hypothetical protein